MRPDHLDTDAPRFWRPLDNDGKRRLRQIARYLAAHWPTPFPVRLRFERLSPTLQSVAETYRADDHLVVRIDSRAPFSWAVDLLYHEHGHCALWPASARWEQRLEREEMPHHGPEFYAMLGEISAKMEDGGGRADSESW